MKGKLTLVLLSVIAIACSEDLARDSMDLDYAYGKEIPHGMIVLGDRLENPYTTANIKAY